TSVPREQQSIGPETTVHFIVATVHLAAGGGTPVAERLRFTVTRAEGADPAAQPIARGTVDAKGEFRFSLPTPEDIVPPASAELPTVKITILGLDDEDRLAEDSWTVDPKNPVRTIRVDSLGAYREKLRVPLDKLPDDVATRDRDVAELLGQRRVQTLDEL